MKKLKKKISLGCKLRILSSIFDNELAHLNKKKHFSRDRSDYLDVFLFDKVLLIRFSYVSRVSSLS